MENCVNGVDCPIRKKHDTSLERTCRSCTRFDTYRVEREQVFQCISEKLVNENKKTQIKLYKIIRRVVSVIRKKIIK